MNDNDKDVAELKAVELKFLTPENLSKIANLIARYQAQLFDELSQITSTDFDPDLFEEAAVKLSDIEDSSCYVADVWNILKLKLKVQRAQAQVKIVIEPAR